MLFFITILALILSKEFLLINDSLIIYIMFAILIAYAIKSFSGALINLFNDMRVSMNQDLLVKARDNKFQSQLFQDRLGVLANFYYNFDLVDHLQKSETTTKNDQKL